MSSRGRDERLTPKKPKTLISNVENTPSKRTRSLFKKSSRGHTDITILTDDESDKNNKRKQNIVDTTAEDNPDKKRNSDASAANSSYNQLSPVKLTKKGGIVKSPQQQTPARNVTLPSDVLLNQLFLRRDVRQLNEILNDLTTDKTEEIFNTYKLMAEQRMRKSDNLVQSLTQQIKDLNNQLEEGPFALQQLEDENEKLRRELQSLKNQSFDDSSNEQLANIQVIFDMFELMTGISCTDFEETNEQIVFTIRQSSIDSTFLMYKLSINKNTSRHIGEIEYHPIFNEELQPDFELVKSRLPDYLKDDLTFPYNTLRNFFSKVSRSLSMSKKT
ncbi:BA75_01074T0 [Komagataella pastoris]|uniref:BA75_01074T0 n=1 Tax=Komagataella pastoris TaxID=4922 RepID=A0A1B2J9R2_PICPA|nr:BA75_01074T0 [Komagataella pastoris]